MKKNLFILISNSNAQVKNKIIKNLKTIDNFDFKFEQNINGKIEFSITRSSYFSCYNWRSSTCGGWWNNKPRY